MTQRTKSTQRNAKGVGAEKKEHRNMYEENTEYMKVRAEVLNEQAPLSIYEVK